MSYNDNWNEHERKNLRTEARGDIRNLCVNFGIQMYRDERETKAFKKIKKIKDENVKDFSEMLKFLNEEKLLKKNDLIDLIEHADILEELQYLKSKGLLNQDDLKDKLGAFIIHATSICAGAKHLEEVGILDQKTFATLMEEAHDAQDLTKALQYLKKAGLLGKKQLGLNQLGLNQFFALIKKAQSTNDNNRSVYKGVQYLGEANILKETFADFMKVPDAHVLSVSCVLQYLGEAGMLTAPNFKMFNDAYKQNERGIFDIVTGLEHLRKVNALKETFATFMNNAKRAGDFCWGFKLLSKIERLTESGLTKDNAIAFVQKAQYAESINKLVGPLTGQQLTQDVFNKIINNAPSINKLVTNLKKSGITYLSNDTAQGILDNIEYSEHMEGLNELL
jgi:hypothetical protein